MTDQELSMLLRQWEPTPAPPTLDAKVMRASRNRRWIFPAPAAALTGLAAGILCVAAVLRLTMPPVHTSPPPQREQAGEQVKPATPIRPPVAVPARVRKTVPKAVVKTDAPPLVLDTKIAASRLLVAPPPVYPPEAKAALVEGDVELEIQIGKDGRVTGAKVLSGDPLLVDAAVESVKQWLFQPITVNGELVQATTRMNVHFTLLAPKPKR